MKDDGGTEKSSFSSMVLFRLAYLYYYLDRYRVHAIWCNLSWQEGSKPPSQQ